MSVSSMTVTPSTLSTQRNVNANVHCSVTLQFFLLKVCVEVGAGLPLVQDRLLIVALQHTDQTRTRTESTANKQEGHMPVNKAGFKDVL